MTVDRKALEAIVAANEGRPTVPSAAPLRSMPAPPVRELRFMTADELRASAPPEPAWRWDGYLAAGAVTLLSGKPKAGKSTLAAACIEAMATNTKMFLDRNITGGPVVLVSEEATGTLIHKLPAGDVRILTREHAYPRPSWPELVDAARSEATRIGAVALVIDTLPYWAGLAAEREKDAGAAQEVMNVTLGAARDGLAVLLIAHARKGGGEDGEAVRGSSAYAGAADIILELDRPRQGAGRQRVLQALSRYPTTPGALLIDHDAATGAWGVIGEGERDGAGGRSLADRATILKALDGGAAVTRADLETALDAPERQFHPVLERLIDEGQVTRVGAGRKGDPFRFQMLRADAAQSPAQHVRRNGQEGGGLSGALPVREHQNPPRSASCAPTPGCAETETLADLLERTPETAAATFPGSRWAANEQDDPRTIFWDYTTNGTTAP